MMGHSAHRSNGRAFLSTAHRTSANEQTRILPPVRTRLPLATSTVPEGLPLRREVAVSCRNAEEEGIVLLERLCVGGRDALVFRRGVHLLQDFLGEGFRDLEEVAGAAGFFNAFGFCFSEVLDVAPCGVLDTLLLE